MHPWLPVRVVTLLSVDKAKLVATVLVKTAVGRLLWVTVPTFGPV